MTTSQYPPTEPGSSESSASAPGVSEAHEVHAFPVEAGTDEAPRARRPRTKLPWNLPSVGTKVPVWLPLLIAVVSFATSTYTFFATNAAPDLSAQMPAYVRVAQGPGMGNIAVVYLQPSFANVGQSARVEVITGMKLRVQAASGGPVTEFRWSETGRFVQTSHTGGSIYLSYEWVSDAQPLLVSQGSPQAPMATFIGPAGWYFTPGAYRATLIVTRQVNAALLERTVQFTFTEGDIAYLNDSGSGYVRLDVTQIK